MTDSIDTRIHISYKNTSQPNKTALKKHPRYIFAAKHVCYSHCWLPASASVSDLCIRSLYSPFSLQTPFFLRRSLTGLELLSSISISSVG